MSSRSTGASASIALNGIDERRQLLVVDLDQLDGVGRRIAVLGDDEGDLLALEQHLLVGQHRLHVAGERRHVVEIERLQVVGGEDRLDARHLERGRRVDRLDARVAVGRADEIAEQHARHLDVVDIVALALDEAGVLDAPAGAAEALAACRRVPCDAGLRDVHSAASFFGAHVDGGGSIALTMFW